MRKIIIICLLELFSLNTFAELSIAYYKQAYDLIYRRLYYHQNVPFKDIVFAIENAYLGNTINYDAYCLEIDRITSCIRRQAIIYAQYEPTEEMALLRAICSCYHEPNEANHGKPFSYDMSPTLRRNYPHYGLVTTLLQTGRGTCRSLPFLFKIVADELGVEAYITLAPKHYFITHQDSSGKWWNFETTMGRYLSSKAIIELTGLRPTGIYSKLYMSPIRGEELMVVCLDDLMDAYFLRTGRYTDQFTRLCYQLGLKFYPNSFLLKHLYNDKRTVLCKRAQEAGINEEKELKNHPDFRIEYEAVEAIRQRLDSIGYQDWTDESLAKYLQNMQNYVLQHPNNFK